jgi:mono/diheme cytochrome c family protein
MKRKPVLWRWFGSGLVRLSAAACGLALCGSAQNLEDMVKQGEQVFTQSCATGYCHGVRGNAGGAPRLAARGFEQAYIAGVVTRGIPDTGMPSFATRLSRPSQPALTGEAVRGARLFTDAVRGFGRCSTCHEVGGFGIPVAAPIGNLPATVAALKVLATPNVRTGSEAGESMPALVLSEGKQNTVFYDLSATPPVLRNAAPGSVKFVDGSNWHHTSAIGAYDDAELAAILTFLRAVIQP